jgi:hypothetical protein
MHWKFLKISRCWAEMCARSVTIETVLVMEAVTMSLCCKTSRYKPFWVAAAAACCWFLHYSTLASYQVTRSINFNQRPASCSGHHMHRSYLRSLAPCRWPRNNWSNVGYTTCKPVTRSNQGHLVDWHYFVEFENTISQFKAIGYFVGKRKIELISL